MKLWLGSAVSLMSAGMAASALAADLPSSAPAPMPPPIPVFTWTGFFLGAHIGEAWSFDKLTETTAVVVPPQTGHANIRSSGFVGGAHGGYNWQLASFVFGAEADIEGSSLKRTSTCLIEDSIPGNLAPGACFPNAGMSYNFGTQLRWQGSARGRAGYALGNFLVYATGGVAFGGPTTQYATIVAPAGFFPGAQSIRHNLVGFTVGGGLEYAITNHWMARVEYRYTDFGKFSDSVTSAGSFWAGYDNHHRLQESAARIGLSYLFNPSLPSHD